MLNKNKIIVIGLDSYDPDLLQRWSQEGRLPFLSRLMSSGTWARLISVHGLFADAPWVTFHTGVNPAKHALYNLIQMIRGTNQALKINPQYCRYFPFWWLLRGTGKKVGIFDVPKTYPVEGVDGIQVAAWGEDYPLMKQSSLPPSLIRDVISRFGNYRHPKERLIPSRLSDEKHIFDQLRRNVEIKTKAIRFLMEQENWDLFVTVFGESHYGGHLLFHHYEPSHWAHRSDWVETLGNTLPGIYSELDTSIEELVKNQLDQATVFIVSVHGLAPNYSANYLMPQVLEKLGFQIPPAQSQSVTKEPKILDLTKSLRGMLPSSVKEFINDHLIPQSFHDKVSHQRFTQGIDWHQSKAFFQPSDHFQGFISINLKGREPFGVVQPGAEYEEVCTQLCQELKRLTNPQTGKPAIRETVRVASIFQGENQFILPDIVILWANDGPIKHLHHPAFGVISDETFALRKTQHAGEGFVIAAGNHIKPGADLTGAYTMDLAPTILYLMGQTIPYDLEGNVLLSLIDDQFKSQNEVLYGHRPMAVPEEMKL